VDKERVVLKDPTHEGRYLVAPLLAERHHLHAAIRTGLHGSLLSPLASVMTRIIAPTTAEYSR
jgi:hypothetical protein